tara:strand:- start:443 stop:643 length:201 start_codon:yes stop_codon:yes gene_type:complete
MKEPQRITLKNMLTLRAFPRKVNNYPIQHKQQPIAKTNLTIKPHPKPRGYLHRIIMNHGTEMHDES